MIHQSREEKIARMECLMDGVLPSEEFQKEEWAALKLENKVGTVISILSCHIPYAFR